MDKGWVKLHRTILEWEWYGDLKATCMLLHLLLTVNFVEKKWRGNTIKPGQIITSWSNLSDATNLTVQECRTAISKLESTKVVTRRATSKFQVITLVNWRLYQDTEKKATSKKQDSKQLSNKQATTTKEGEERKNENVYRYIGKLSISNEEHSKLLKDYTQEQIEDKLDGFENGGHDKTKKSIFLTIKNWLKKDYPKKNEPIDLKARQELLMQDARQFG